MNKNETVLVERTIAAPIEKVWQAWENPEKLAKWWRLKDTKQTIITEYSFRPGGTWSQHAITDKGFAIGKHNPGVTFKEIIPMEKIVTVPTPIDGDSVEVVPGLEETVVTFERVSDNQTRVRINVTHSDSDDWRPNELLQSVYDEIFDNLAIFTAREN